MARPNGPPVVLGSAPPRRSPAHWLRRDDRALARKLRGRTLPDLTAEWLIIAPLALGLLMTKLGEQWHLAVCGALGALIALVAPLVVRIWLSQRHRPRPLRPQTKRRRRPDGLVDGIERLVSVGLED
jgi:hypothetical protein